MRSERLPAAALALLLGAAAAARGGEDAEAGTHTDEASTPQVSFEERTGNFILRQYQLGCLSQLTYLLGGDGEAAVVDPQRDVDHYLRDAQALGLRITKVLLTHTNADFVAGHAELAARTGAKILVSGESRSEFEHQPLRDGDKVALGGALLEFWATPGHTLDCITILVRLPGAAVDPAYGITGDTLFIGSIGRPDLVGGEVTPMLLAGKAWDSVRRLKTLPDGTKILPAHGAGSLCGAHLSPDTVSTMGRERETNPFLRIGSRAQFVSRVVSGLPPAPPYFAHNVAMNRKGPPAVDWKAELPPAVEPKALAGHLEKGAWLVDLRGQKEYAAGHVRGAINVALRGRLDTWTGIVVPFEEDLYLLGSEAEVKEAAFRLRRIGYDRVRGFLPGGMDAWRAAGLPVRTSALVSPGELARRIEEGTEPILVDVRTGEEHAELRIGDYANIPVTEFALFPRVLDRSQPVVMICNSAYRSSIAVGLAERQGFEEVGSLDGGIDAWLTAGLPTLGTAPVCAAPAAAPAAAAPRLPEPIEPGALARALLDSPGLYAVLDVRPGWQHAEYHVPGARSVEPTALKAALRALPPATRVVLVDRDGTSAFALAGALLADPEGVAASLRVLVGGTARYWSEVVLGGEAQPRESDPAPSPAPPPAPPPRISDGC